MTEASTTAFLQSITSQEVTNAWLIIYATKNNWWLRNLHTGQCNLTGVPLKVAVMLGHPANDVSVITAYHTIGHWACTKLILARQGVTGILRADRTRINGLPQATRYLTMRVMSGPSGYAQVTTYRAILVDMLKSAYSTVIPSDPTMAQLMAAGQDHPEAHKDVGSWYLQEVRYVDPAIASQECKEILSSYIFAVKERSHLAKANVIIQHDEIRTHAVYQNLVGLRAQMLDKADAARSIIKVNFLLNQAAAGTADPHSILRQQYGMPDVAAPTERQIVNMLAGRGANEDAPAQGGAQQNVPPQGLPAPGAGAQAGNV